MKKQRGEEFCAARDFVKAFEPGDFTSLITQAGATRPHSNAVAVLASNKRVFLQGAPLEHIQSNLQNAVREASDDDLLGKEVQQWRTTGKITDSCNEELKSRAKVAYNYYVAVEGISGRLPLSCTSTRQSMLTV
jgi:hypothetical protein